MGAQRESNVVLKSNDQMMVFDLIKAWQPTAKKIVITRDGRDAAISGYYFAKLMREQNAPFRREWPDFWGLLKVWSDRAEMVAERARQGELYVLRYEDLTRDFAGTLKPLLQWLGLEHSDRTIEKINEQTSFEATTGRSRGTEAKNFKRKGVIGEWTNFLSEEDKEKAWRIAGKQLTIFGYCQNGDIMPLPDLRYQQRIEQIGNAAGTTVP